MKVTKTGSSLKLSTAVIFNLECRLRNAEFSKQRSSQFYYMDAPHERWPSVWKDNLTAIAQAVLNQSCRQHHTKQQLCGHPAAISKTIQTRRARHVGHFWRSKVELISDVLLWTLSHRPAGVGRQARTYVQHLCTDIGWNMEDLPKVMDDRDKWRERVREIRANGTQWWWWWRKSSTLSHEYLQNMKQ